MSQSFLEDLHRYAIACELAEGKLVLEIPARPGFGSSLLARVAKQVVGLAHAVEVVNRAQIPYPGGNITPVVGAYANLPFETATVDLVVNFERFEDQGQTEAMLADVARILRSDGIVVVSRPSDDGRSGIPIGIETSLRKIFRNVYLFTAGFKETSSDPLPGTMAIAADNATPTSLPANRPSAAGKDGSNPFTWEIALASNGTLPSIAIGAFECKNSSVRSLQAQLAEKSMLVAEKDRLLAELNMKLLTVRQTLGWKLLTHFRRLRDRSLPIGSLRRDVYWTLRRIAEVLLDEGPTVVVRKISYRFRLARHGQDILPRAPGGDTPGLNIQYEAWLRQHQLKPADLRRMRTDNETFNYRPVISILTPVYNIEEVWLRKAVESVQAQVYGNWELCLVNDNSDKPHLKPILDEYAASDPRIRVKHLPTRAGIAGASSVALALATGEFVGLLDHDDELTPDALWEVVHRLNQDPNLDLLYSDEDKLNANGAQVDPFFKPGWSPDLLLSTNYITHFGVFRRSLLEAIGGFRSGYEGAQDHDLLLRFTEKARNISHIAKILYHWRMVPTSFANSATAKPLASENGRRAVESALQRRGYEPSVAILSPGRYAPRFKLHETPLISIIIPTKNQARLLRRCVASIEEKTTNRTYEIIIIDNNSDDPDTVQYLDALSSKWPVLRYRDAFNFSAICNFGSGKAKGEYLLFLNDDTEVISSEWLTAMLEQAQRPEVGAVGAKLLYQDNRIQHAGMVLGILGLVGHAFRQLPDNGTAYLGLADLMRNCSAVTGACMMVRRKVFEEVGGFDEELKVVYGDVDLCLRLREQGYLIVYTPFAVLYHFESATRGALRPATDEKHFCGRWDRVIRRGDPYYHPSLTLTREDWSLTS